jgi:hypothetical protein
MKDQQASDTAENEEILNSYNSYKRAKGDQSTSLYELLIKSEHTNPQSNPSVPSL